MRGARLRQAPVETRRDTRIPAQPQSIADAVLMLQHTAGNRAVVQAIANPQRRLSRGKKSRHDRKRLGEAKRSGELWELRDADERPATAPPAAAAPAAAAAQPFSKEEIAAEFAAAMADTGVTVFLSGGAALAWRGGERPAKDLDFRVTEEEVGFANFNEPDGRAVLQYINDVVLATSRQRRRDRAEGVQANAFAPIGDAALTIGTNSWFGVEISLSVVPFSPATSALQDQPNGGPRVRALTLEELRSDKAKSAITRRKKGEASLTKVSQDLFDFVSACRLIDQHEPVGPRQHALAALADRPLEYAMSNLEGGNLHHLPAAVLIERMLGRLVLTAEAHVKHGARRDAFEELLTKHLTKRARDDFRRRLRTLAGLHVDPEIKSELRSWMESWDQAPYGPDPDTSKPRKSPAGRIAHMPRDQAPVEDLLAIYAGDFVGHLPSSIKASEHATQIVRILQFSGGFRVLDDSSNSIETIRAFGLSANQFSQGFRILRNCGWVEPAMDGLHLTASGDAGIKLAMATGSAIRTASMLPAHLRQ